MQVNTLTYRLQLAVNTHHIPFLKRHKKIHLTALYLVLLLLLRISTKRTLDPVKLNSTGLLRMSQVIQFPGRVSSYECHFQMAHCRYIRSVSQQILRV